MSTAPSWTTIIDTAWGGFAASLTETGIAGLSFPGNAPDIAVADETILPIGVALQRDRVRQAIDAYIAGEGDLAGVAVEPEGTAFQQAVWRALRVIPRGRCMTYGSIAEAIGHPSAARAVGNACGANPIPLFIPCHRVLASGKRLGGFSGGLDWKRHLLTHESIAWHGQPNTPQLASA